MDPTSVAGASGGGGTGAVDVNAIVPVLGQLTTVLTQLVGVVSSLAQGQAGAAGAQPAVAGESGAGVSGGGAVGQAPGGCGCGGAVAQAAGDVVQGANGAPKAEAAKADPKGGGDKASGDGKLNSDSLKVKGTKMSAEQKRLTEIVLKKGKEMGASKKVLEAAVATMIQESTIKNDSSVDSKDHDSLGLFQQRPSAGWGTRAQISDPEYAAKKFFEKAIPNDKKHPDYSKAQLAQSVQISAFPDAYAKWDKEAAAIVADYMG